MGIIHLILTLPCPGKGSGDTCFHISHLCDIDFNAEFITMRYKISAFKFTRKLHHYLAVKFSVINFFFAVIMQQQKTLKSVSHNAFAFSS